MARLCCVALAHFMISYGRSFSFLGISPQCGSHPDTGKAEGPDTLYLVMAAATLIEAIYDAEAEDSELPTSKRSPQVAATLSHGYPDVIELKGRTPPDVLDYIRDKDR
jgi:hypothetical protein